MAHASSDFAAMLRQWDQKSKPQIVEIYQAFKDTDDFLADLLDFCGIADLQGGATWLIKHHCEQTDLVFSPAEQCRFYETFEQLASWDAQLHALQTMHHVPIPKASGPALKTFLFTGIAQQNKLVRAWSYYGLALLARRFPEDKPEVLAVLDEAALQNPSGAIAVRLRKARALLP
ncbi:hypothetical protein [uncultured Roseobacter sp.]|uniref:hypothetical protein n=1 Tax=uncultured Roseobacter sp. TaxID=114847 RepID=UPI00260648D9|nr:hypothetical protein [uncultured Roseobacter sp.]